MIDSHTHLYSQELSDDINQVIQRAGAAGVTRFYMPAIDSETHQQMIDLEVAYPGTCFAMMGLHPCSVKENYQEELAIVEQYLTQRKFAAIGEAGLDFYWDTSFKTQQYIALRKQIALALQYNLPLILHTRNAMQETIDCIKEYHGKGLRGIFHCFGGSADEARQIMDCGFLLGIGGVLTYKKSGLDVVLKDIDLQHMVLETDSPYLAPVPYRGKRNESAYIKAIAVKLAETKGVSLEEVDSITTHNALKLFGE